MGVFELEVPRRRIASSRWKRGRSVGPKECKVNSVDGMVWSESPREVEVNNKRKFKKFCFDDLRVGRWIVLKPLSVQIPRSYE